MDVEWESMQEVDDQKSTLSGTDYDSRATSRLDRRNSLKSMASSFDGSSKMSSNEEKSIAGSISAPDEKKKQISRTLTVDYTPAVTEKESTVAKNVSKPENTGKQIAPNSYQPNPDIAPSISVTCDKLGADRSVSRQEEPTNETLQNVEHHLQKPHANSECGSLAGHTMSDISLPPVSITTDHFLRVPNKGGERVQEKTKEGHTGETPLRKDSKSANQREAVVPSIKVEMEGTTKDMGRNEGNKLPGGDGHLEGMKSLRIVPTSLNLAGSMNALITENVAPIQTVNTIVSTSVHIVKPTLPGEEVTNVDTSIEAVESEEKSNENANDGQEEENKESDGNKTRKASVSQVSLSSRMRPCWLSGFGAAGCHTKFCEIL